MAVIRTFDAAVPRWDDPSTRKKVETHVEACHVAMRALVSRFRAVIATRVDDTWVQRWAEAAGTSEGVRLASVITASWVGVEHAPTAPGLTDSSSRVLDDRDAAREVVAAQLAELGLSEQQQMAFLSDDASLDARVRDDTVWVNYLPSQDMHVPYVGWSGLDARLTGTPEGPGTGAMAIPLANILGRALGTGDKADPQVPTARARRILALLADADLTTVADLAAAYDNQVRDGDALAAALSSGIRGRAPAIAARLTGRTPGTHLDSPYTTTRPTTLRDHLTQAAAAWLATWEDRAQEEAAAAALPPGHQVAGTWLADAIGQGLVGADFARGPFTDLAVQAASVVATHRAQVYARAAEWAQGAEALATAAAVVDADALTAVDEFTREHGPGQIGPTVLAAGARRYLDDVLAAWQAAPDDTSVPQLLELAASLGATWTEWIEFLAASPRVREHLPPVLEVHAARAGLWRLGAPTFTRPHPVHAPRETTYGSGYWTGRLKPDGTLAVTIWDGADYSRVRGIWRSRRASEVLGTKATLAEGESAGMPVITRLDATSRLASGLTPHQPAAAGALVDDATFCLRTTGTGLGLRLAVQHEPPRPTTGPLPELRTVMGVTLGMRRDVTWAIWRTATRQVAGPDIPADVDTLTLTIDGKKRPARRVGPPAGDGPWFAHPVREGTIRTAGGSDDRWATRTELDTVTAALAAMDGLNARVKLPEPGPGGKVRRGDLLRTVHTILRTGQRAQRLLAMCCSANAESDLRGARERLARLWPLPDGAPPAGTWTARTRQLASLATFTGTHLLRSRAGGLSLRTVAEIDDHLRILRAFATWPTPTRPRTVRHAPEGYAAALVRRRDNVRRAWAKEIASRIVKDALSHDVDVIAIPEDTGPTPSRALWTSAENARLAAWAHREVADRIQELAQLHGLRVTSVAGVTATWVPTTNTPTAPMLAVPLAEAVRFIASTPQWTRTVARARRAVTSDDTARAARARLTLAAADALTTRSKQYATLPLAERGAWLNQRAATTIHLPHPAGQHVAPITTTYDPTSMRTTGLMDRDVVTAHTAAWRGIRRNIRQT